MSLPKLRQLDKYGVITDPDPFDLPTGAWSMGVNVRFEDGRVKSAPVWRDLGWLGNVQPRFCYAADRADNSTSLFIGFSAGEVINWTPQGSAYAHPVSYTPQESVATWTGATLAEVVYVNREDRVPWSLKPTDARFSNLSGWDSSWRAKVIRSYASALIALNITKGGVRYPTMVKTSDLVEDAGLEPPSWDATLTTNNATENLLTEMNGEIVEAQPLGSSLILYSNLEAWQMTADASSNVFNYRKLPFSAGAINTNCVVEVNNRHYVFGTNDFWVHDGLSMTSLADGRVRKWVFKHLNAKKSDKFFVAYNAQHNTISFHFVSNDPYVKFNGEGCNRAAVLNLTTQTWAFDDCPLVFSSAYAKVSLSDTTWATATQTWDTIGGTWADMEDGFKRTLVYVGETKGALYNHVYARDLYGEEATLSSAVDPIASQGALLIRDGMDLDELDVDLRGYKAIIAIYPQGRLEAAAAPLSFSFGMSDYPNQNPTLSAPQTYNAMEDYKLDFTATGRFLSLRMEYPDYKTMSLSGIDVDLDVLGER